MQVEHIEGMRLIADEEAQIIELVLAGVGDVGQSHLEFLMGWVI